MPWGGPLPGDCSRPRTLQLGAKLVSSCRTAYATYTLDSAPPALSGRSYSAAFLLLRPRGVIFARPGRGIGSPGYSRFLPSPASPGLSRGIANGSFLPPLTLLA